MFDKERLYSTGIRQFGITDPVNIVFDKEIRKMCEAIGRKVLALHRSKIENISVKNLKIGEWRYLTDKEVSKLLSN